MSRYTTTVTRKGQITIPAEVRHEPQIREGDRVVVVRERDHAILRRAEDVVARTAGALSKNRREPVPTAEELRELAEWAIAEDVVERMGAE